jgi:Anti-sigma-K factor rskA/Putative zinc-finger
MTAPNALSPDCHDVREALPAYALGALDPEERLAVEHHLETCAGCRAALEPFANVATAMASAPPPVAPPPSLRARLLTEIQAPRPTPPAAEPAPTTVARRSGLLVPRWAAAGLAAAAVLLIAGIAVLALELSAVRQDRDTAAAAERKLAAYLSAGGQVTKLNALPPADYGSSWGHGTLVTAPGLPPLVVVDGCPPTTGQRLYRVWLARGDKRTGVGEIKVDENGSGWLVVATAEPVASYDTVGVTMVTGGNQRQDLLVGTIESGSPA